MNLYESMESNPASGFGGPPANRRSGDPADGMQDDDGPGNSAWIPRACNASDVTTRGELADGSRQADKEAEVASRLVVETVKAEFEIVTTGSDVVFVGGVIRHLGKTVVKKVLTKEVEKKPGSARGLGQWIRSLWGGADDAAKRCPHKAWGIADIKKRGVFFENALGKNTPDGYRVVDRWKDGVATSIKSMDIRPVRRTTRIPGQSSPRRKATSTRWWNSEEAYIMVSKSGKARSRAAPWIS